MPVQVIS